MVMDSNMLLALKRAPYELKSSMFKQTSDKTVRPVINDVYLRVRSRVYRPTRNAALTIKGEVRKGFSKWRA